MIRHESCHPRCRFAVDVNLLEAACVGFCQYKQREREEEAKKVKPADRYEVAKGVIQILLGQVVAGGPSNLERIADQFFTPEQLEVFKEAMDRA